MFELTPEEWTAIRLSLRIALVATAVALPFGVAAAWVLARKNFWGKALLDGVVHLPLVLPPVVTGYLLLISFGKRGPVGAFLYDYFGIVFSFRWTGAALACGVMAQFSATRPVVGVYSRSKRAGLVAVTARWFTTSSTMRSRRRPVSSDSERVSSVRFSRYSACVCSRLVRSGV